MRNLKMLGLLAIAGAALMAFVGTASATTLTSPTGTSYTGIVTAESHGTTSLHGAFVTVSCAKSHVEGKIEKHGVGVTVSGKISTLSFTECNFPVTVVKPGSLEVHAINTTPSGSNPTIHTCTTAYCTGTLTSTGAEIKIHTSIGECIFTTSNTDIGEITPTNDTGGHATFDIGTHGTGVIPRTGGSFFCGSTGQWTGSYTVTTPSTLWIDH
jgi:hypothetical protein